MVKQAAATRASDDIPGPASLRMYLGRICGPVNAGNACEPHAQSACVGDIGFSGPRVRNVNVLLQRDDPRDGVGMVIEPWRPKPFEMESTLRSGRRSLRDNGKLSSGSYRDIAVFEWHPGFQHPRNDADVVMTCTTGHDQDGALTTERVRCSRPFLSHLVPCHDGA
ncbi:hypothetical protein diail_11753 [Diaporthe ilicicola]|nr:hypothetical protein diail_11753 [Diaporthe ilicicola]